jgi:hypothetical protein
MAVYKSCIITCMGHFVKNEKKKDIAIIYETSDGGKTVTMRNAGSEVKTMVLSPVSKPYCTELEKYAYEWDNIVEDHPGIKQQLDKLITLLKITL